MNLVKRWRKHHDENKGLAKRKDEHYPLGLFGKGGDFGRQIDDMFDRVWRDPWGGLAEMTRQLDQVQWPAVDVAEDDKHWTVRADVPGLSEKDLDIEVSGNVLTLRGHREDEWTDDKKRKGVRRRERVSGSFVRTIPLPSYVDGQQIEAKYDRGTLTLTAPKIAGKGPRRVTINA
jgi:HSP20 family protein